MAATVVVVASALRTYLVVPGERPDRLAKALARGADAVILDLEDAVAPPARAAARPTVARVLPGLPAAGAARLVVRINSEHSEWFVADLSMLADWARALAHGFGAKLRIHPRQVAPIHAALAPSVQASRSAAVWRAEPTRPPSGDVHRQ